MTNESNESNEPHEWSTLEWVDALKELMRDHGIKSAHALSVSSGVHYQTVHSWITGRAKPALPEVVILGLRAYLTKYADYCVKANARDKNAKKRARVLKLLAEINESGDGQ